MQRLELKIPPVIVFLLAGLAMKGIAVILPQASIDMPAASLIAASILSAGVTIGAAGVWAFRRHRTTVLPHAPGKASVVVSDGVFQYTRNPMYLGLALILGAWAVKLGNVAALLGLPLFIAWMNRFQIVPEERALADKFGAAFDEYVKGVRRWL